MKIKPLILLITLFVSNIALGQISGYQGKRFLFSADGLLSPCLSNPNANGNKGVLYMNFRKSFSLEYVINRKTALTFSYINFNSKIEPGEHQVYYNGDNYNIEGLLGLRTSTLALGVKLFTKDWIAPLGSFVKFDFEYMISSLDSFSELTATSYFNNDPVLEDFDHEKKYYHTGIYMTIGEQRIVFDRIVLKFGIRAGVVFMAPRSIDQPIDSDKYLNYLTKRRLFTSSLLNFQLGVGILLY